MRGSYYCEYHLKKANKKAFRYRNSTIYFDLDVIKPKVGKIKNLNLIIYDAFVDQSDRVLLLVNYSDTLSEPFWLTSSQILASKIDDYIEQLKRFEKNEDTSCHSSKMYALPCEKKARTVGVFLACSPCGVIIGFREIFGHETLAQTALFFMLLIDTSVVWPKVSKITNIILKYTIRKLYDLL